MFGIDLPKVENPEMFPAWAVQFDTYEPSAIMRGKPWAQLLAERGLRVTEITPEHNGFYTQQPWTYLYMPVSLVQSMVGMFESLETASCSVILDCHFPITQLDQAYTIDDPDNILTVIEHKDDIIESLKLADLVTVPHPDWAEELAEITPHVFLLPDLIVGEGFSMDEDSDYEPTMEDMYNIVNFTTRMSEAATQSTTNKRSRPCRCPECVAKREEEVT